MPRKPLVRLGWDEAESKPNPVSVEVDPRVPVLYGADGVPLVRMIGYKPADRKEGA